MNSLTITFFLAGLIAVGVLRYASLTIPKEKEVNLAFFVCALGVFVAAHWSDATWTGVVLVLVLLACWIASARRKSTLSSGGSAGFGNWKASILARGASGVVVGRPSPRTAALQPGAAPKVEASKFSDARAAVLRFGAPGHICVVAPPRKGKTAGIAIPTALTHPGSMVVFDPKGEIHAITARARRAMGQKVVKLSPLEMVKGASLEANGLGGWNPLDWVRDGDDLGSDVRQLAEALIAKPAKGENDHFAESARIIVGGLLAFIMTALPAEQRRLTTLLDLWHYPKEEFDNLMAQMSALGHVAGGLPALAASTVLAVGDREFGSFKSTITRGLAWMADDRVKRFLARSDVDLDAIKADRVSVFLCIPHNKLDEFRPLLRMLLSAAVDSMIRTPGKPSDDVIFMVDEAAALGHSEALSSAIAVTAGYGVKICTIWQSIDQIKRHYEDPGVFLGAGCRVFLGVASNDDRKYVSDALGKTTIQLKVASESDGKLGKSSTSYQERERDLMTPEEVERMTAGHNLVFVTNERPLLAEKLEYWNFPPFAGKFDSWAG
jgi:type IV secretory pathway TraG/TraD family ATPase VirD4